MKRKIQKISERTVKTWGLVLWLLQSNRLNVALPTVQIKPNYYIKARPRGLSRPDRTIFVYTSCFLRYEIII